MATLDLQIADAMKRINQYENATIQKPDTTLADSKKTTIENKTFEIYIDQMKKNRVYVNKRNYTYQTYNFLDGKISIPLRQNDFMPLMSKKFTEKHKKTILYNRDGCFLNLSISTEPCLYKSLIFFKHQIAEYYKHNNTPINWIKISRTETLKYGIYKAVSNNAPLFVISLAGECEDKSMVEGNFTCPENMKEPWLEVFEASLHLLKMN